jgi:hypothetical protein
MTDSDRMKIPQAVELLQKFYGSGLTSTLAGLEAAIKGATLNTCASTVAAGKVDTSVLAAANLMKRLAGQINVVIRALGILLCLPRILEKDEVVTYVSLGAGNTGRPFDLETNERIAEFKFINWQGGPESIRQNSIFKDFYGLAEHSSTKRKYLYVLDTTHPLKFFNGGRALSSVLSRNDWLKQDFERRFKNKYRTVREYYALRKQQVILQDISAWVPGLAEISVEQ